MSAAARSLRPQLALLLLLFVIVVAEVAAVQHAVDGDNTTLPEKAHSKPPKPSKTPAHKPGNNKRRKPNDSGFLYYTWCLARSGLPDSTYQSLIDYACVRPGVNCGSIQNNGLCWEPNNLKSHADYALNYYYYVNSECIGGGIVTSVDPSYGLCHYPATGNGGGNRHA